MSVGQIWIWMLEVLVLQRNAGVLLFKDRHTPPPCLCPCMLHTHKAHRTESRAVAGGCSTDQHVFPLCGAPTITIFTLKFNQVVQNLHRAHFLWLFVHPPSAPLSLCQSPWCLKVQMWCLEPSPARRRAVENGVVFVKPFRHLVWASLKVLQENSALAPPSYWRQKRFGRICWWCFDSSVHRRTFTVTCKDCNYGLF